MPDTRIIVASLRGTVCPSCGGKKGEKKTLCYTDFMALPRLMRNDLWLPLGNGYEEALERALKFLEDMHGSKARFWPEPELFGGPR